MLYLQWAQRVKFGGFPIDEVPEQIRETVRRVVKEFDTDTDNEKWDQK